jgi:hypothetical protein
MKGKNHEESSPPQLSLRIIPMFIGLALMFLGIYGSRNGIVWWKSFSQRTGTVGVSSTADFIGFGALTFLIGAVPWNKFVGKRRR